MINNKITAIILISVIFFFISVISAFSQQDSSYSQQEEQTEQIIENIAEQSETEFENTSLIEQMDYYKENPLNLNKATKEQLQQFGLLTEIQVSALLKHLEKNGDLISIYELQSVQHFDLETIKQILPFIKIKGEAENFQVPTKDLFFKGKSNLFIRYQTFLESDSTLGYWINKIDSTKGYLGSPVKLLVRYRNYYSNKISYGFTAEKDAGEEFFNGSQKNGFDFYSAHLFIRDINLGEIKIQSLAVGDYELKFGQGLICYQGISFGKSPSVMQIKKGVQFLRQYTSTIEANFMRGIGATFNYKDLYLTTIFSHRKVDANISETDTINEEEEVRAVSSLLDDGYHRTKSELENKNSIKQTVVGSNLTYQKKNLHFGFSFLNMNLNVPLKKNIRPDNQFDFSGTTLISMGIDYGYLYQNFNFFGEIARSGNGGLATLNGVLMSLDQKADVAILYRNYQRNYQSLFANAFAESTRPVNEKGTYLGLSLKPTRIWRIDSYFDFYRFPWLKYLIDALSDGYDALLQITYKPNKVLEMYGRGKYETKSYNASSDAPIDYLAYNKKTNLRYHISYKVSKSFTLKTRLETVIWNDGVNQNQFGYMFYQDVNFKAMNFPVSFAARFGMFDVEDYDARIYTYENDVQYSFSIPSFSGKWIRMYLLAKCKIIKGVDFEIRLAQSYAPDAKVIASNNDLIKGNKKTEIKAQLKWMF